MRRACVSCGEPTTMARHCARERATLRRLALSTKGMPWAPPPASAAAAESSSKSEWVSETIETGASWPWKHARQDEARQ